MLCFINITISYICSAMKETWNEAEFVLQPPLSQKEIQCAEQVARELELLVEKVSHFSRIWVEECVVQRKVIPHAVSTNCTFVQFS